MLPTFTIAKGFNAIIIELELVGAFMDENLRLKEWQFFFTLIYFVINFKCLIFIKFPLKAIKYLVLLYTNKFSHKF